MENTGLRNNWIKKFQSRLKLAGYNVRRELVGVIVDEFHTREVLSNSRFDSILTDLCNGLEKICEAGRSIELEHVNRAIEISLNQGCDKDETVFSVINAFEFPKLYYDAERKRYTIQKNNSKFLSDASTKTEMFLQRYESIAQRIKRIFASKFGGTDDPQLKLQTVDFLLTSTYLSLDKTLILGSILVVSEGKFYLEDPTGKVLLDIKHANFEHGFFMESGFVLVNGIYEDKTLKVSSMLKPPGEEYNDSRVSFGNINYFGGPSKVPLRDSPNLKEHCSKHPREFLMFLSDVWLDHYEAFNKLETIFNGFENNPPIAFVFLGSFLSDTHDSERLHVLKKYLKYLGELIAKFPNIQAETNFIFVPSMVDPCNPHVVPRLPLPKYVTQVLSQKVPKAIFATSPCRIQYCHREIVVFRADILGKMLQGTIYKPKKENIPDCVTKTIVGEGHLVPLSLNSLTVHWDFDYTLRLYPLPDLIVIGDKAEIYEGSYKGCQLVNPGPFCTNGFQFTSYNPALNKLEGCEV